MSASHVPPSLCFYPPHTPLPSIPSSPFFPSSLPPALPRTCFRLTPLRLLRFRPARWSVSGCGAFGWGGPRQRLLKEANDEESKMMDTAPALSIGSGSGRLSAVPTGASLGVETSPWGQRGKAARRGGVLVSSRRNCWRRESW